MPNAVIYILLMGPLLYHNAPSCLWKKPITDCFVCKVHTVIADSLCLTGCRLCTRTSCWLCHWKVLLFPRFLEKWRKIPAPKGRVTWTLCALVRWCQRRIPTRRGSPLFPGLEAQVSSEQRLVSPSTADEATDQRSNPCKKQPQQTKQTNKQSKQTNKQTNHEKV